MFYPIFWINAVKLWDVLVVAVTTLVLVLSTVANTVSLLDVSYRSQVTLYVPKLWVNTCEVAFELVNTFCLAATCTPTALVKPEIWFSRALQGKIQY